MGVSVCESTHMDISHGGVSHNVKNILMFVRSAI